jgi:hypothetical protein
VALFASQFSIVDPFGTPPINSTKDALDNCLGSAAVFSTVSISIINVYQPPDPSSTAVQWNCNSVTKTGCKLDFGGVDVFTLDALSPTHISSVLGYFDPSIPSQQMNCTKFV